MGGWVPHNSWNRVWWGVYCNTHSNSPASSLGFGALEDKGISGFFGQRMELRGCRVDLGFQP